MAVCLVVEDVMIAKPLVEIWAVMVTYEPPYGHKLVQGVLNFSNSDPARSFFVMEAFMRLFRNASQQHMAGHVDQNLVDFLVSQERGP
jgi:hypothetical protein